MGNQEYLGKAAYARLMADAALTDALRAGWLELAARWLEMVKETPQSRSNVIKGVFEPKPHPGGTDQLKTG